MSQKKITTIAVLLVAVITLSVISANLLSNKGKSNNGLDDFLVADTAAVDQLILSQSTGFTLELMRKDGKFVTSTGDCIQKEMINNVLHTFTKVAVRSYVPENSVETLRNNIRVNYRKVKIFQNGKWVKTWWIGNSTPDHYGTYALLETPEDGLSEVPVILEMRGLKGSIDTRFTADGRSWACSAVFDYAIAEIQSVVLKHSEMPEQDFKIKRVGSGRAFEIKDYQNNAVVFDTLKLVRYLDLFKKAHFESVNYTMTTEQIDSMKQTKPWVALELELINGQKITLDAHRMKAKAGETDFTGNPIEWDGNRLWAIINKEKLVKIQYFTFDPIFVDISFFGGNRAYTP